MARQPRPLADLLDGALGPVLAAQGFVAADVVASWPEIVGERLAPHTRPLRVEWPRRPPDPDSGRRAEPAVLVVRVTGAFALELQHSAPIVIERVNAHFGWRCIGRLALRQGPVGAPLRRKAEPRPPDPQALARVLARLDGIADEGLRDALARLGRAVAARGAG